MAASLRFPSTLPSITGARARGRGTVRLPLWLSDLVCAPWPHDRDYRSAYAMIVRTDSIGLYWSLGATVRYGRTTRTAASGRQLPVGAGAAKRPFADMRSLSIVCFRRTLGTAAPGQNRSSVPASKPSRKLPFEIVACPTFVLSERCRVRQHLPATASLQGRVNHAARRDLFLAMMSLPLENGHAHRCRVASASLSQSPHETIQLGLILER